MKYLIIAIAFAFFGATMPDEAQAKGKGGTYAGGKGSSHKGGSYVSPKGKRYKK